MIRVLVVEDSPLQRNLLKLLLESDGDIQVVGVAENGAQGVEMARALKPDLITMDIRMPVMNGFEATRRIMQENPTPIVVVSASVEAPDLAITFNAIKAGALEVIEKPANVGTAGFEEMRKHLLATVKGMAMVRVKDRKFSAPIAIKKTAPAPPQKPNAAARVPRVLVVGASTGGPPALAVFLKALPHPFSLPVVIVQHMAQGFTRGFVDWLKTESALPLAIANENQITQPGTAYFAPDDTHLIFTQRGLLKITHEPPVNYVRPSVTVLFNSVANVYGADAIGVLLTGMGIDGGAGLLAMHQRGAYTIAQDEATSSVYGMPKAAADLNAADEILPLQAIAPAIVAHLKAK